MDRESPAIGFMKLFIVFYVSNYTVRKAHQLGSFRKGFLPMLIVV